MHSDGNFNRLWSAPGIPGSPVIGPGALCSLGGSNLYAINGHTGAVIGHITVGPTTRFVTPMLLGNRVYVGTTTGVVSAAIS